MKCRFFKSQMHFSSLEPDADVCVNNESGLTSSPRSNGHSLRDDICWRGSGAGSVICNCCGLCPNRIKCFKDYKAQRGQRSYWSGPILCRPLRKFIRKKENRFVFAMAGIIVEEEDK